MTEEQQNRWMYTLYLLEELLLGELEDTKLENEEIAAPGRYGAYKLGEMSAMKDTLHNLTGEDKWNASLVEIKKSLLKGEDRYI